MRLRRVRHLKRIGDIDTSTTHRVLDPFDIHYAKLRGWRRVYYRNRRRTFPHASVVNWSYVTPDAVIAWPEWEKAS